MGGNVIGRSEQVHQVDGLLDLAEGSDGPLSESSRELRVDRQDAMSVLLHVAGNAEGVLGLGILHADHCDGACFGQHRAQLPVAVQRQLPGRGVTLASFLTSYVASLLAGHV